MEQTTMCEHCNNYVFDDAYDGYICMVSMDEDDIYHLHTHQVCPYYQSDDDYLIVKKQN